MTSPRPAMISQALARPYFMDADATHPVILTVEAAGLKADLTTVDWLARLALLARRQGGRMAVRGASEELRGLIDLTGLDEVLAVDGPRLGPGAAA